MRICWTTGLSYEEKEDVKKGLYLYTGKWAGHRFDIVMPEDSLAKMDGRKDITAEILSEAQKLRRCVLSGHSQKMINEVRASLNLHIGSDLLWAS